MSSQVWWFVSRSSGIIAWALLTLSVCWGLFISTKAVAKASTPSWLLDLHRFLGGIAVTFTAIHLIGLWADSYVEFGWSELFVPMASEWKPGPVAWGIVSIYLLVAIELTSLAMKFLPRKLWRGIHHLSLPLYAMATYHGVAAGTDKTNQVFRLAALASINIVTFLAIVLILAARRAAVVRATAVRPERIAVDANA
jgi:DMSO/TMAO reductase YedYZ heme-binding membrane subunit